MSFIIGLLAGMLGLVMGSNLLRGVHIRDWTAALVAAFAYSVFTLFLNWILTVVFGILTLPVAILTLGLFWRWILPWIVSAVIMRLTASAIPGFNIDTWRDAFLLAAIYTFVIYVVLSVT